LEPLTCSARAESSVREASLWVAPKQALRATAETGKPTLLVVTSQASAASQQLMRSLRDNAFAQRLGQMVNLSELQAEQSSDEVRRLGVGSFPTVIVYRREGRGLEFAGRQSWIGDADSLFRWVRSQVQSVSNSAVADRSVVQAAYADEQPSPQAYPQACPPAKVAPPSPPANYVPVAPPANYVPVTVAPPAQYTAAPPPVAHMVTAPPPASVMINQQPATLFVGPAPPPNVVHVAPAANLFTGAQPAAFQPAPVAAFQPAPVAAFQPAPVAAAFMPVAPAPAAAFQPAAPAGGMGTAIILRGPGLFRGLLASLGRALSNLGNPTIQMNTTASFATAQIPMGPAQPAQYQPVQPAQYQPAQYQPPPAPQPPCQHGPYPSAQTTHCSSKFCGLLHNHSTN
jgi:hypothetical protein